MDLDVVSASSSCQDIGLASTSTPFSCCFSSWNLSWNLFFSLMAGLPRLPRTGPFLIGLKHFSAGRGVEGRGRTRSPGIPLEISKLKGSSRSRFAVLSTLQFLEGVISPKVRLIPLMGELSSKLFLIDLAGEVGSLSFTSSMMDRNSLPDSLLLKLLRLMTLLVFFSELFSAA